MTRRLALITGGSEGIGLACAQRLGGAGFGVVVVARRSDPLANAVSSLAATGIDIRAVQCDVSDESEVERLFAEVGDVDVLVNNAGVASAAWVTSTTLEDWNHNMVVNATGPFLCTRAVMSSMLDRGWGRIVTVASTAAVAGTPMLAAYAASKHAAVGLMRVAAAEVAGTGVTANAICPGYVRTPMTDRTLAGVARRTGSSLEDAEEKLGAQSPLGRLLEPQEVAAAVAMLCSEEASAINGQVVVMDGGGIQR